LGKWEGVLIMFALRAVTLAVIVTSAGIGPAYAAPVPPSPPFRITASLDRKEYLPHEPIFLEWTVTYIGNQPVEVAQLVLHRSAGFPTIFDAEGKKIRLEEASAAGCGGEDKLLLMQPQQTVRGWIDLRSEYVGIVGPSKFTLLPRCFALYRFKGREEILEEDVTGKELSFTVVQPKEVDALAVAFIREQHKLSAKEPGRPLTPLEQNEWDDELARHERNLQRWIRKADVLDRLREMKSERFRLAASFYRGQMAAWHVQPGQLGQPLHAQATVCLRECRSSPVASRFVKGLAALYLIQANYDAKTATLEQTRKAIDKLLCDYPQSAIADEASEFLDQITKPKKNH
jgi:hypothetical protein